MTVFGHSSHFYKIVCKLYQNLPIFMSPNFIFFLFLQILKYEYIRHPMQLSIQILPCPKTYIWGYNVKRIKEEYQIYNHYTNSTKIV